MKKICILFGGESSEHDISIITGMQLYKHMKDDFSVEKIYLGLDNNFYLASKVEDLSKFKNKNLLKLKKITFIDGAICKVGKFLKKIFEVDIVINCCHGGVGENGDLAGFFEVNKIRYTSASSLASAIAMDKSMAKLVVSDLAPVIQGVKVTKNSYEDMTKFIEETMPDELIVKPNSLGSSIGVRVCDKFNFREQINAIFEMNDDALVERRIVNIAEYNQACIKVGDKLVLSAIEEPYLKSNILSFEDKYKGGKIKGKDREIPAKISDELKEKIDNMTRSIYERLNMKGVVRIDYIFDKDCGEIYFNEINTIPGSMAFYLFEPIGIDYISLVGMMIESADKIKNYTYFDTDILKDKEI